MFRSTSLFLSFDQSFIRTIHCAIIIAVILSSGCSDVIDKVSVTNKAPSTKNDLLYTLEDRAVTRHASFYLDNDADPDAADRLSIQSFTQPSHGSFKDNANNTYTYTPNQDYNGQDELSYTITDGQGHTTEGQIKITIEPLNDAPRMTPPATKSFVRGDIVDFPLEITDPDGDSMSYAINGLPDGLAIDNNNAKIGGQIASSARIGLYNIVISFNDGQTSSQNTFNWTVTSAENIAPTATNDTFATTKDTAVTFTVADIINNDSDQDGGTLSIISTSPTTNGSLTYTPSTQTYTYTPTPDFYSQDEIEYTLHDGQGGIAQATITIQISNDNDEPQITNPNFIPNKQGDIVEFDLIASDIDSTELSYSANGLPPGLIMDNSGKITGTLSTSGEYPVEVTVSDNKNTSSSITFTWFVSAANNHDPKAENDTLNAIEGSALTIDIADLLANDTDIDNNSLIFVGFAEPKNGTLTKVNPTTYIYQPNPEFYGIESIIYALTDGQFGAAIGVLDISVQGINSAPVINNPPDNQTNTEADVVLLVIEATDSDLDTLNYVATGLPPGISISALGVIQGQVPQGAAGSYNVSIVVNDGVAEDSITFTWQINEVPTNQDTTPPVITLNGASTITLVQGDAYVEAGATATDDIDTTVSVTVTGTVDTNTPGSYTLTYNATDSANNTSTATRTVVIIVTDTTPPTITLNGPSTITLVQGDAYIDAGATATDNIDTTVSVTVMGTVDTNTPSSYTLTYTATDSANNTSTATRTILVVIGKSFITTWKTDNPGVSTDHQIRIGTTNTNSGYNYTVDWGDGLINTNVTRDITHSYATPGTYTVKISGEFPRIIFGANTDSNKLLSIEQWGTIKWQSMNTAFANCENLVINATDVPNLSQVTDMGSMFAFASNFNHDISTWDVSSVTDMSSMFKASNFNYDINTWDVSSVTNMSNMFNGAINFNQNLSNWDVSSVMDMSAMFSGINAFNQDLSMWDVSSVTDMSSMFAWVNAFNQDLSAWNVSSVTNMSKMFYRVGAFNQDLSAWDVSSVMNMSGMFHRAFRFNQHLNTWDVSSVTDMSAMFVLANLFNQDLSTWDVSSVTDMSSMFSEASNFNQDLSTWDVSSVTTMRGMFSKAYGFNQNLSTWNVSSVTNMDFMFSNTSVFNQNLNAWNVSAVTTMFGMFMGAISFNQDLSTWNVSSVTNMWSMFNDATSFNQDLRNWNVSSVGNMSDMFNGASAFNQDLSTWNVSSVKIMSLMFNAVTLSTANYDALLLGWSAQSLQNGVTFSGGNSQYSGTSQSARDTLTTGFGWTVTDGGVAP